MKKKPLFFSIVCCITFCACNNHSGTSEKASTICKNWQLTLIQDIKDTVQLNTSSYQLSLNIDSSFSFIIEDNLLNGKYVTTPENLLQLKDITKTDVCCNTNLGKKIETFFSASPLHYSLLNDTALLLHVINENSVLKFTAM